MHREVIDFAKRCSFRWRELAFSERDKLNRQLDESRKACDKLTDERENLFKQLEEAVKVGLSFETQFVWKVILKLVKNHIVTNWGYYYVWHPT